MTIPHKLEKLRNLMASRGMDAYLVATDDYHCSEYVGDYFKCRHYISGFTGSAGTALITGDFAGLWTDGRYFIQAAAQLKDSGFTLMKMGQEGVPTIEEYLKEHLGKGQVLGFDARTVTASYGEKLERILAEKGAGIEGDADLIGEIWTDRPALSCRPVWELDTIYSGKSRADKLREIRKSLAEKKADYLLLASLADIAWLLNLRGDDVSCTPVFLSYLVLSQSRVRLFAQAEAFPAELQEALRKDGVELLPTIWSTLSWGSSSKTAPSFSTRHRPISPCADPSPEPSGFSARSARPRCPRHAKTASKSPTCAKPISGTALR